MQRVIPALCDPVGIRHGPPRVSACAQEGNGEGSVVLYSLLFIFRI